MHDDDPLSASPIARVMFIITGYYDVSRGDFGDPLRTDEEIMSLLDEDIRSGRLTPSDLVQQGEGSAVTLTIPSHWGLRGRR